MHINYDRSQEEGTGGGGGGGRATHTWNSLPNELRESNSLVSFESKIVPHIFE